jgi:acetylornithine deacetylase/succinyl-diaminopimelate desuccinylase-like protein
MSQDAILSSIDREEVVKLTLDLVHIPSPRGQEKQIAEFIYDWMIRNGIPATMQEVSTERYNVIGRIAGSGGGRSLIFNAHMDTGFGLPEDYWIIGDTGFTKPEGLLDGDKLIGRSVINDKGPLAAFLVAAKAIRNSKVKVKGDIILTAVAGGDVE